MALQQLGAQYGIPCHYLGLVGEPGGDIEVTREQRRWAWSSTELRRIYHDALPRRIERPTGTGKD